MSRIVLATGSAAFEQRVRRAFTGTLNGELTRWQDEILFLDPEKAVRELADTFAPSVVAIGPNVPVDTALDLAASFDAEHPEVGVVIIVEPSPDLWERALRSGVRDVLTPDASDDEIRRVFDRLLETAALRRDNLMRDVIEPNASGKIITVLAPKGGSGKTALATNLAAALSASGTGRVCVVDLDLQFGDVAAAFGLKPERTMGDLLSVSGGITATTLKVFLTPRNEDLFVLCAPETPAEGEQITESDVVRMLNVLAAEFDYVVVDTSAGLSEATLAAIERSTDLLFICDLSVSAVRGLRKVIDALDRLDMSTATRHFVLNRADSKVGIEVEDAARVIGMPVDVEIPSSRSVPLTMNQGVPVVEDSPRSPVAKRIVDAALRFTENELVLAGNAPRKWRSVR